MPRSGMSPGGSSESTCLDALRARTVRALWLPWTGTAATRDRIERSPVWGIQAELIAADTDGMKNRIALTLATIMLVFAGAATPVALADDDTPPAPRSSWG